MKFSIIILLVCCSGVAKSQTMSTNKNQDNTVIEIRSYTLKPGTRDQFHKVFVEQSLPMVLRWKIDVLGYGPSLQEDSSYYLIRGYKSLEERAKIEDAFYGSDEWKKGPREAIVSKIINYTTVILPADSIIHLANKINAMKQGETHVADSAALSALNKQFIENFMSQQTARQQEIIHPDFVCIERDGTIVGREEYMKGWATGYETSGYTSFGYTDELIRIFGNTALVRSKTVYTKLVNGRQVPGNSIYTDTYVKENGSWKCVQAQLTAVAVR
jgi:uncharacterized protein DUF4440/NIPSNAP protein